MSRITVPSGYTSWNAYIQAMVDATPVDIDARRALKRDIKLGMIAAIERSAGGDTSSPSYRIYHTYDPLAGGYPWS